MDEKIYFKSSKRKNSVIEKPFETLTDELKSIYSAESLKETEAIKPILESASHLFEVDNELSMWKSIYDDLSSFGVSHDLSKLYDYKKCQLTLRFYLEVRAGIEDNAYMCAVAYALDVALAKTYFLFHEDINGLASVVDLAYFSGKTVGVAAFQREISACSGFSTVAATKNAIACKEEKIKEITVAA